MTQTSTPTPVVPLPNSLDPQYVQFSQLSPYVEIEFGLKSVDSVDAFVTVLGDFVRDERMDGLRPWIPKLETSFRSIKEHCLRLPELFPRGTMEFLQPGSNQSMSLSLAQTRCLMAHRFIGSFKRLEQHPNKWPPNLNHWLIKMPSRFPEGQGYLECVLDYFSDYPPGSADENVRAITYSRYVLGEDEGPNWKEVSGCQLMEAFVVDDGTGIGSVEGEVMVDFANEDIGPSVAGTQEEIIFGACPELQPAVLFAGRMRANEAIVMSGARQYGKFTGYGSSLVYRGRTNSEEPKTVLAIDAAISRPGPNGVLDQLSERFMARELRKAFVGFR
eukprot:CAMPEP_0181318798 /NCGR_PEP_ID=MMETSP1101-20121128/17204_1 /TAXON_ID=46948 /ORGANISM="Rhodomonas abbreviata, Strain Caron Lab Isolate" /LENGTH=330 /DNA_ID=CAMNT_0023426303 /DNA_START=219 /DNA_END=1208 /DNA_ORIENTATION=+